MNIFDPICPICGRMKKPLEVNYLDRIAYHPHNHESEAEEQARAERIKIGTARYKSALAMASGLVGRNGRQTFDNFNPDEQQRQAKAICMRYAAEPKGNLIISGGVGSGKTHLSAAIVDYICGQRISPQKAIRYADGAENLTRSPYMFIRAFDITESARLAFDDKNNTVERCKLAKLLVIDDLGTRGKQYTEFQNATLFDIMDIRYNFELPTVITTNLLPDELKKCIDIRAYDRMRADSTLITITSKSHR